MKFKTINPATEKVISDYETMSMDEIFNQASECNIAFNTWKKRPIKDRINYFQNLSEVLRDHKLEYAKLITLEMGKPLRESITEIEKCAWAVDVYVENSMAWLSDIAVEADGKMHSVIFQPLGVLLSIMPWNFPFWQVLRFAIPSLIAGNVSILKHSNTVPQCASAIEGAFEEAGFPKNVFKMILADHDTVVELLAMDIIKGVSFTGSTQAGMRIAELAGRNLKKVVLELGGSDPFIVLEDAEVEIAAKNALVGRTINAGQSCIAAKRFIVVDEIAEEFIAELTKLMSTQVIGNPTEEKTNIGPLVNEAALKQLENQINDAIDKGAKILTGGKRSGDKGYFYEPTVLINITLDMKVMTEEIFAPVAPIFIVENEAEAIRVANDSSFGLGGSVWTKDLHRGERIAREIEAGSVFVNSITKSDPRMPFGGVKKSGIGRELSHYGLMEFVNIKGLNIYEH